MKEIEDSFEQLCRLGTEAPELASYQDEPPQMPTGTVGKKGYLRLGFAVSGGRSVLRDMDRRVPFLVQRALYWDEALPQMPCIFVISTAGCILQGDRLVMEIHVAKEARGHVTTQSATKIHSMRHNYAAQLQKIVLEEGSYLEMMPDSTIPHSDSRFINETQITLHSTATLLYSEILMSGRKYHPEDSGFRFEVYTSQVKAKTPEGRILFSERYVLEPKKYSLKTVGIMGIFDVFGNVVLLTPLKFHQAIMDRLQPLYDEKKGIAYGVSRLPNESGLIFKALGKEAHQVKEAIQNFWRIAREEILGVSLTKPLWR
ncbi:urease accessory protein [Acetobacteraceae bacterium]|nr:urease accessory protein [Acetobacteraceae bacterium]